MHDSKPVSVLSAADLTRVASITDLAAASSLLSSTTICYDYSLLSHLASLMDHRLYMSHSRSEFFADVPVYVDEATGQERSIDWKGAGPLLTGCMCRDRRTSCSADEACTCEDDQLPGPDGTCVSMKCAVCVKNPARCYALPACECRKNVTGEEVYVCNDACHGRRGLGCYRKARIYIVRSERVLI